MKPGKSLMNSFAAIAISLLAISGCKEETNNGNIPVDSTKVNEHVMPIEQAIQYTKMFRDSRMYLTRVIANDTFFAKKPFVLSNAEYFNRDAIAALLNKAGNDGGIRIYLGQAADGKIRFVLVPATKEKDIITPLYGNGRDSIPGKSAEAAPAALVGDAVERGQECPEVCPDGSPLN